MYVFCLLNGNTAAEANPLNLDNWDFYVVPTAVINEKCGNNKTISLSRIKNMGYNAMNFLQIKDAVDSALSER